MMHMLVVGHITIFFEDSRELEADPRIFKLNVLGQSEHGKS
jgi:hypothetical protein